MNPTERQLDDVAQALIPILDKVGDMHKKTDSAGYFIDAERGVTLPEADHLELAIPGPLPMAIIIHEPNKDGSSRIVLSPDENWVVKSVLMSGLDSSTEIELILVPRI